MPSSRTWPARAAEARLSAARVPFTVEIAPAEALPYDDATFDHVVSSLVFCSVADPSARCDEIDRVLRPGGALHMVEHVRPATPVLADFFSAVTPWWSRVACNCHLTGRPSTCCRPKGGRCRCASAAPCSCAWNAGARPTAFDAAVSPFVYFGTAVPTKVCYTVRCSIHCSTHKERKDTHVQACDFQGCPLLAHPRSQRPL
ncbi:MAG: class I SAM-dependent methyltransferase [Caldilineaceae bacterium]|nr:class I SAM-dependent methyltransferase [Caldilineaceae bacterium]